MIRPKGYWKEYDNCDEAASQCSCKSDFHSKYRIAYDISKKNNWLNIFIDKYWNESNISYEECKLEADKYNNRAEFYIKSRFHYNCAKANGWLKDITSHMSESECYWTYERCKIEFSKYNSKKEVFTNNEKAYRAALHNGWLDELCSNMIHLRRKKYSKEDCLKALEFSSLVEFEHADASMLHAIRKNGWTEELLSHMPKRKQWTIENLKTEALKYKYKVDFLNNSPSAYTIAARIGILDSICQHMEDLGDMYRRAIYAWEFSDRYVYVGLTCDLERRGQEHLTDECSPVFRHMTQSGLIPIYVIKNEYIHVSIAKKLEGKVLREYISQGWKKLNSIATGGIGKTKPYWTEERLRGLAEQCMSRKDFMTRFPAAYSACSKKKMMYLLDEYFPKIIRTDSKGRKRVCKACYWTDDRIFDEAKKYSTYSQFVKGSPKAHNAALRWNLRDQLLREVFNKCINLKNK